jgi:TalC/MipB family fructose-6-phosphate aldolase
MKLWLDTIDFSLIEDACKLNTLAGVTTNPSILAGSNADPEVIIRKLLDIQPGGVAVQTTETEFSSIVKQARRIAKISERIVIKIPAINDGFRAIAILEKEDIHTLATTIFEVKQIIFSGMLGATYAAPYVGRIESATGNAFQILSEAQSIISKYHYGTKIMAAGIRTPEQFIKCAALGIAAATIPEIVYKELFSSNSDIDSCLEKFNSAWQSNDFTARSTLFCGDLKNS